MKNLFILIAVTLFISSCNVEKKALDTWLGSTKQNLLANWGPPASVSEDGAGGQILTYADKMMMYNQVFWHYKYMYVNQEGKIYRWMTKNQQVPPTQVDVRMVN